MELLLCSGSHISRVASTDYRQGIHVLHDNPRVPHVAPEIPHELLRRGGAAFSTTPPLVCNEILDVSNLEFRAEKMCLRALRNGTYSRMTGKVREVHQFALQSMLLREISPVE